jgi:RNA polymerase sigma-70 factor, ECF subfamily
MGTSATDNPDEALQLKRALEGDNQAWASLLAAYRPRLRRMVAIRLHPGLRGRIDPSDVLQDAFAEATARLASYAEKSDLPLFLWLRWLTGMRLKRIHREHFDVKGRDARREVSLRGDGTPGASSAALAEQLLGGDTRPSEAAARAERKRRVEVALEAIDPTDREVLVLRHFEELTNVEAARVLRITPAAASKRYVRALVELKRILGPMLGESRELRR